MDFLRRTAALLRQDGALERGQGMVSGVIALALGLMSLLAVLAFHFPQYLTTPELRREYPVPLLRQLLLVTLALSGGMALANLVRNRSRWLNASALLPVLLAVALGGSRVPVGDFADGTPYLGLDWFLLDLLASALGFIALEKCFPLRREQPVFRVGWQTDLTYFAVNHCLVGLMLLAANLLVHRLFGWAAYAPLQQAIQALPFAAELLLILLVADLIQYWLHRACHQWPLLWRFHAIHHSTPVLDWLAGSRLHVLEVLVTRVAVLGPLYALGFSKSVLDAYIVIVGIQAVLNHANVRLPFGPLRHLIVTPDFHHWHHSSEHQALDRNYAAHFSFLDRLFGTQVKDAEGFPQKYGVLGDTVPQGFWKQQLYPLRRKETR